MHTYIYVYIYIYIYIIYIDKNPRCGLEPSVPPRPQVWASDGHDAYTSAAPAPTHWGTSDPLGAPGNAYADLPFFLILLVVSLGEVEVGGEAKLNNHFPAHTSGVFVSQHIPRWRMCCTASDCSRDSHNKKQLKNDWAYTDTEMHAHDTYIWIYIYIYIYIYIHY